MRYNIVMKPDREKAEAVHEKHMARFEEE